MSPAQVDRKMTVIVSTLKCSLDLSGFIGRPTSGHVRAGARPPPVTVVHPGEWQDGYTTRLPLLRAWLGAQHSCLEASLDSDVVHLVLSGVCWVSDVAMQRFGGCGS